MSARPEWDRTAPFASTNPEYTPFHPRWHRERIPIFWWVRNRRYMAFIARELTSVLVLYSGVLLVATLVAAAHGAEAFEAFLGWLARPWAIALHTFVLAGLLFHTITWLNLAPRALVLRVGGRRVPPRLVLAGHYAAWIGLSTLLVLVVLLGTA
jgi:fumarate reductase subunit C